MRSFKGGVRSPSISTEGDLRDTIHRFRGRGHSSSSVSVRSPLGVNLHSKEEVYQIKHKEKERTHYESGGHQFQGFLTMRNNS
jgi:hypothetical protein